MGTRLKSVPVDPADDPADDPIADPAILADYQPVQLPRTRSDGWTAQRQRTFLVVLAETGSISHACTLAGISRCAAYRLRRRPDAVTFAQAWDRALRLAADRWAAISFVSPRMNGKASC